MDTDGVSERRRATRASNFKVSNLEEILPGAKIIPPVNQVCRDHSTGEDYYGCIHLFGMLHNQSLKSVKSTESNCILERCDANYSYSEWSTEGCSSHDSSSTRTDAWRSCNRRPGSIKVGTAEGSDSDNVRHLLIWLMGDD